MCDRLLTTVEGHREDRCYTDSGMNESGDPWQEYRRRRNLALFAFFGYVPVIALFAVITETLLHVTTPVFVAAISWMLLAVIVGNWFIRFPCPRCGKPFFMKWWGYNTFARRCLHCKLPLNAPVPK